MIGTRRNTGFQMKMMRVLNQRYQRCSLVRTDRGRNEDEMIERTLREAVEDVVEEDEVCLLICQVLEEVLLHSSDYIMEDRILELLLSPGLKDSFHLRQWDTFHLVFHLT